MKKLLYSILALAGVVATSCTQEHVEVQYIPGNVVAPTLGAIEGCDLSDDGADIVVDYTEADFGVATGKAHNLYVAKTEDMAEMKKATAKFENGKITVAQSVINVIAMDFAEPGSSVDMYFAVVATLSTDKGATVAGTESMSNVVKATFKSFNAEVLPSEKFDKVWVIGDYCGWDHSKTQFLFDYASSGNVYSGVVDFADKAANGFKLTASAGWDDGNYGEETKAEAADEPSSIQLIDGGGSQDIKRYAKRFYGFEFDKTTLVLKKSWGADQIGIIGLNGDWTNDVVMEYNPVWTRFYADIEVEANGTLKFRADAAWDLNWGAAHFGLEGDNDGNIFVEAGNYRVYFNPVSGLLEFSASKYNTEEDLTGNGGGTTPEPEPQPGIEENRWGVVGTINSWGGTPDLYMNEVGENLYVRMGVTVTDADQFKVRFNNGWDINYGAAGDVEPFAVTVGEEMTLVAGGKNLSAPAGTYDIYFNIVDFKMWVMPEGETPNGVEVKAVKFYADVTATGWTNCNIYGWGDLGEYGGTWPGTALSTETVDGKEYYAYTFDVSAIGKTVNVIFNNGSEQTVNIENIVLDKDYIFTLTEKGGDGKWLANVNGEAPAEPEKPAETTYGLLGEFNGWGDDVDLVARGDGWFVATGITMEGKFLIRFNDAWDEKFGFEAENTYAQIGENALTYGGADMWINAGTYDFYLNPTTAKMFVANAGDEDPTAGLGSSISYGLVGTINSWTAPDVKFEAIGDGGYKLLGYTLSATEQIKIRANEEWNDAENYGLASAGVLTTNAANTLICGGGSANMSVAADGTYDFYFYPAELTLYVMEAGQVPAR